MSPRDGLTMRFVSRHAPIERYIDELAVKGLLVERLRESKLPEQGVVGRHSPRGRRIPLFLHVRAVKPA